MNPAHRDFETVTEVWLSARRDLGIDVSAPYEIAGTAVVALVRTFGSEAGTVVLPLGMDRVEEAAARLRASEVGYFVSIINPAEYATYVRSKFEAMLNDWGWFGPRDLAPDWYSGRPWGC